MRRASNHPRPADLPQPAGTVSVSQHVISANGPTAITSGRIALGASPCKVLRGAPTARYARLARVGVASWTAVSAGERETLTAPLSERATLAIA
jgi:hypothetical protein